MTGSMGRAIVTAALLSGGLALGAPALAAIATKAPDLAATAPVGNPAPADSPATLRDAVELAGQHFGFTVIGAGRLGTDAPEWPAEDLPADGVIDTLLKDYSYIVLLKPETVPGARREPGTLVIVGLNHPAPDAPAAGPMAMAPRTPTAMAAALPVAALPAPAAATSHVPSWAPPPSTVVRTLTKLAETNGNTTGGVDGSQQSAQPTTPMPNPAENAAAMAALTRSAQNGLGALVTGLRQACPNPKAC
jgi:hypothetical protein